MKNTLRFSFSICILLLCVVFASNSPAQTGREVLTNRQIIELVRLGLSEAVIVEKIRQSECRCDTGTTALAELKAAKVSDTVF